MLQKDKNIERWLVAICSFVYFVSYFSRKSFAAAMVGMISESVIDKVDGGFIGMGLFVCYGVGQLISGYLGDRIKPKHLIMTGVVTTFVCNLLMVVCTQIGVWLPSPDYLDATANAYNSIFNYVPRIVIASLVGFLCGELSNAWLMEWIRKRFGERRLWVRTIGSSVIGYLLDTIPFVLIAFAGTLPTRDILLMIALQYFMKLGIEAFFGTPMAYSMIAMIKRRSRL